MSVEELATRGESQLLAYAAEMEPDLELDPDWDTFKTMEDQERLVLFGAWSGGELVGFVMAYLSGRVEQKGSLLAYHQGLYVEPEHRGAQVGHRLIRAVVDVATAAGATGYHMHAPRGSVFEQMLPKVGFEPYATLFKMGLG